MQQAASPIRSASTPVRGTQSFVHTLSWCGHRPSLAALEVLWRWACGLPLLLVAAYQAQHILATVPLNTTALQAMTFLDPMGAVATLSQTLTPLLPPVLAVARWLAPLAAVAWVIAAGLGRTAVLRRADPTLHARRPTLILLYALRLGALVATCALWFVCIRLAGRLTVLGPIDAGSQPDLVLYCAIAIVVTLALFTAWAVASWSLSAAPLLAMRRNLGAIRALAAALRLRALRSKLIEINLVIGIVKIALIVLAMVFSASPLPFESVATPAFMQWWYVITALLYLLASDLFHVVHLVAYLDLWNAIGES